MGRPRIHAARLMEKQAPIIASDPHFANVAFPDYGLVFITPDREVMMVAPIEFMLTRAAEDNRLFQADHIANQRPSGGAFLPPSPLLHFVNGGPECPRNNNRRATHFINPACFARSCGLLVWVAAPLTSARTSPQFL